MKRISKPLLRGLSAGLGGLAVLLALQMAPWNKTAQASSRTNPPARVHVEETPLSREVKLATSFASVVKKVAPSVVNIYSSRTIREQPLLSPFFSDPFFRRFFGPDFDEQMRPRTRRAQSLGSGVIVSEDGYILTANHVVEGADEVKVALADGVKEYPARVIGADPPTDVAVLKVEAKGLPAVTLADSDKLEVGDVALALGNPFGVGQTVTMGIVSAVGRSSLGINEYENFIQTDASINPGNSGGALVDAQGRLVGINTAILSRTGGNQGIGFAVPVNMARSVMDRIIKEGKVTRGYLGINLQPLTGELAKEFNLPDETSGVLVGGVTPNSAADKAGLKHGDVILEINGKKATDPRTLQLLVAQAPPASKITLRVLRSEAGGKPTEKSLSATLDARPEEMVSGHGRGAPGERGQPKMDSLDGVEVADLDGRARQQFGIPNNLRGALVINVEQNSNAAEAGLRQGDVILEINRQPVRNADDAVTLSKRAKGDHVLLRVWSRAGEGIGGTHYIVVDNRKPR